MMFFLWFVLSSVSLLCILHQMLKRTKLYRVATQLSGPYMYPIIGNGGQILFLNSEETFDFLRNTAKKFKKSNRLWVFGRLHYLSIDPTDLEILITSTKYIRKLDLYKFLHPIMNTGLLTSTGDKWFHRRKILTPAFHFNILKDFLLIFKEESHKLVNNLADLKHQDGTILQEIIPRFTLNTICETAMGVKLDSTKEPDIYRNNILIMGQWIAYRAVRVWFHLDFIYKYSGFAALMNIYVKRVHNFSWTVIDQRRKAFKEWKIASVEDVINENIYDGRKKRYAMLDTLLAAEANGFQIDENGIREEVDTFMFEGYDTTSVGLLFTLFMLSHHVDVQESVYEEILNILGDKNEKDLAVLDYADMHYLNRVIKETIRLYPPVPFVGRELDEPLKIGDVELPIGTQFHIHIFDMHRDPKYFPDPEKFDPDRFLPENENKRHPFAYIPFSAGPRNCIGQKFAMLEIKTVLVNILLNYKLVPITKIQDVSFLTDLVLRPKNKIEIKFVPRHHVPTNVNLKI